MKIVGTILLAAVLVLYFVWLKFVKSQKGTQAKDDRGVQVFDIVVKGAYQPNVIEARVGAPVKINFSRQENSECSRFVGFSDFNVRQELPEGKITSVEFTPRQPGEFAFTCDMGMYRGRLIVN